MAIWLIIDAAKIRVCLIPKSSLLCFVGSEQFQDLWKSKQSKNWSNGKEFEVNYVLSLNFEQWHI